MNKVVLRSLLAPIALFISQTCTSAQDGPSDGLGDWEVTCADRAQREGAQAAGRCQAAQRLMAKETGESVFAFTMVPTGKGEFVGIVSVPSGGYLAPGLELRVDGRRPYKLLIETCNASGCHAGFPLKGAVLSELRSGKQATFRAWTAKEKPVDLTISLDGFSRALATLRSREGL